MVESCNGDGDSLHDQDQGVLAASFAQRLHLSAGFACRDSGVTHIHPRGFIPMLHDADADADADGQVIMTLGRNSDSTQGTPPKS